MAQIAAFVPPTAPMVVPTRVVAGDMAAIGLFTAIGFELLGTLGLILLAARVYERAILRTGAPVHLRGLLGADPGGREPRPPDATHGNSLIARIQSADRVLRLGVVSLLAGVAFILTDGPGVVEIVLVAAGLLLLALHERGKWNAPRPSR